MIWTKVMARQLMFHQMLHRLGPFTCSSLAALRVNRHLMKEASLYCEGLCVKSHEKIHSRKGWVFSITPFSMVPALVRFRSSEPSICQDEYLGECVDALLNDGIPEAIVDTDVSPSVLSHNIALLLKAHYSYLQRSCLWMHENIHIGFIQMAMTNRLDALTLTVRQHGSFVLLCEKFDDNCQEMSDCDLLKSSLAMLYLGLKQTSPLMHKLLAECRSRLPTASPTTLASTSSLLRATGNVDTITAKLVCAKLKEFCEMDLSDLSSEDIHGLSETFINCEKYLSSYISNKYISLVHDFVTKNPEYLDSLEAIGVCLRLLQRAFEPTMSSPSDSSFDKASSLLSMAVNSCSSKVEAMNCHHVAEICQALKWCRRYDQPLSTSIQNQALLLLNEKDCQLRDISNLMFCTSKSADPSLKKTLQRYLYLKLKSDTSDIIIISNLADNLVHQKHIDKELLKRYQGMIVDNAEDLISHLSRFTKVARFLMRKKFVDPEDEAKFVEVLQRNLELQGGVGTRYLSVITMYLLSHSRNMLSDSLYKRLQDAIPQWKGSELYRLSIGLNSMRKPISLKMQSQVDHIQLLLHTALLNQLDSIRGFNYLHQLTLGLVVYNQTGRDANLTHQLMHKYLDFTPNLSQVQLMKVASTFHSVKYDLPEAYEDLVQSCLERSQDFDHQSVIAVLSVLAKVGYQPKNSDKFILHCLDVFHDLYTRKDAVHYDSMLKILVDLVHLSYLPEEEISMVFTLEFIENLDVHLGKRKSLKKKIMDCMVQLNRAAVLECPQLDIPWFHEKHCCDHVVSVEPVDDPAVTVYRDEVEQVLTQLLGLEDGYRRWVYSPYFWTLDFDCILDENQDILNIVEVSQSGIKKSWQRVAILTQTEHDFCYGSRQLDGPNQTKIRHLEIMDYKVVQIPHYDWFSMGLTDWQMKADYIQAKIWE